MVTKIYKCLSLTLWTDSTMMLVQWKMTQRVHLGFDPGISYSSLSRGILAENETGVE